MKKWIGFLILIVVVFQSHYIYAQNTGLSDCIRIALENNSQLRTAGYNVERSKLDMVSARSNFLPQINSSFGSSRSTLDQTQRITEEGILVPAVSQTSESHFAQVNLTQNIFDFGRSFNYVKQANALNEAAQHSLLNTRMNVIMNVKVAYYELLKAHRLEEVYQGAVDLADEQVKRTQTMMEIGLASQAEVYQAKVNYGTNKLNLINQKNYVEISRANLNNAMGRRPDTPIEIAKDETGPDLLEYSFEEAIEIALENNEEIKALQMEVESNRYAIGIARGRYLPAIGGQLTYSRGSDDFNRVYTTDLDHDFRTTIGIGMNLNIFNGFADQAAVQNAKLGYQVALENLAESKRQLIARVKQYFLELESYRDILEINEQNIQAAQENLRLQQEKRRVGSGTELDVTQAQVELVEAQSTFVRAEYSSKMSNAQLEAVMGIIEK